MAGKTKRVYRFGNFQLGGKNGFLYRDGALVCLPPKVLETLQLLVAFHGQVLAKDEMMKHLWPDTFVEEGTLAQYVFLLRRALGDSAAWIQNYPRRGYSFTAPVEEFEEVEDERSEELPLTSVEGAIGDAAVERRTNAAGLIATERVPEARRQLRLRMLVSGFVLVAVLTGGALIRLTQEQHAGTFLDSVAVLPFRTALDPGNDYLADGITDAVITKLSSLRGLRVVSYSRVRQFKTFSGDAAEVGRQLGVGVVIEGTLRVRSGQMRLSVHAVDTRTADTIWADDQFEADSASLPLLERQVTEAVARRLKGHLTSVERDLIKKSGPKNAMAYDLVLQARAWLRDEDILTQRDAAVHSLRRAIAIDPTYADAHGWLAFALANTSGERPETIRDAISHANQAFSVDPNSHIATRALARIQNSTGRTVEGLLMAKRVLDMKPDDVDAIAAAAEAYFRAGLSERALTLYEKALTRERDSREFRTQLARIRFYRGEYKDGIDLLSTRAMTRVGSFGVTFELLMYVEMGELARAVQIVREEQARQSRPVLDGFPAYCRGGVLEAAGDRTGARQIWSEYIRYREAELAGQENPTSLYGLSLNHAKLGNGERALQCIRRLLSTDPRHPTRLFFAAEVYALLGSRREALDSLKAAVDNGFLNLPMIEGMARSRICTLYSLRNDHEFLAIRADLVRRIEEIRARY
jgi:DNA-binding winged helix-turn-helix (wHTH) protein/TolB-like protein/tetratricopeptide (TPR) repeat protein